MMKVLITGANGQIGQELVAVMQEHAISYVACDRAQLDITDATIVDTVVNNTNPDIIINAAAYTAVDAAEDNSDAAFRVNRDGVENLALACRQKNIPLLHISTDFVFDGEKQGAYEENDPTNPLSIYGKSKLAGEQILRNTWQRHIILRTSWVYSSHGSNFVKTMLRLMREREQLQVVDDQWGCPTSAKSIAVTLREIAKVVVGKEFTEWGIYHFCSKNRTNWHEFAKEILVQAKHHQSLNVSLHAITSEQWQSPAARPKNSELSSKKLKAVFGADIKPWQQQLPQIISDLSTSK